MAQKSEWPKTEYETLPWHRDPESLLYIPKSRRRKILAEYQAALPPKIAKANLQLPDELGRRISELELSLVRFDALASTKGYSLPALLLRSESSSSSQIENLTSSVRNVALAELSDSAPSNAQLIANNVAAMRLALETSDDISIQTIVDVHSALMGNDGDELRAEQVWIGGTQYSPHGAIYVPPHHKHLRKYLDDLCAYAQRDDVSAIAKAAIVHAQFESIHPFTDGNGRTGRTLLHKMLRREGILASAMLPVSSGLLHDVDAYMDALEQYHHANPVPIVECVTDALELALSLGIGSLHSIDAILEDWTARMRERSGSAIYRLPNLLVNNPVVNAGLVAEKLQITVRAANNLIDRAVEYGILTRLGNRRRGVFYQANELIDVLEDVAQGEILQRVRV